MSYRTPVQLLNLNEKNFERRMIIDNQGLVESLDQCGGRSRLVTLNPLITQSSNSSLTQNF